MDSDAVWTLFAAIARARAVSGPVRAVVHGAGVLHDGLIADKTDDQFNDVYSTKVDGWHALMHAAQPDVPALVVAFSSSTARFGRRGQADYAAANEVLNKLAAAFAHGAPASRVLSVNWGPWDGGMVNDALKRLFVQEGIEVIAKEAGTQLLLGEIAGEGPVETVVLGAGSRSPVRESAPSAPPAHDALPLAFERRLSLDTCPILRAHVLGGHAVLPMALIIEWLAHGAMHNHPGLRFTGFEQLRILKGVTLESGATLDLQIRAGEPAPASEGVHRVHVALAGGDVLHADARILLAETPPAGTPRLDWNESAAQPYAAGPVYSEARLFHGAALQCIDSVTACDAGGICAHVRAAPAPGEWMSSPVRSSWIADPLALDGAFQLMILWSLHAMGARSLPTGIRRYTQFARQFPRDRLRVVARAHSTGEHGASADIEFLDEGGTLIARMEGYECVADASLDKAFMRNSLATEVP